jgi:GlpG protein
LGLTLVLAVCSNLAQYYLGEFYLGRGGSPSFGGMSGVIYGLLGYVWIRGKRDPGSGLYLHPTTVTMMIVWFFACFTGVFGSVANSAHAAGFGLGIAWGYLSSMRYR